MGFKIENFFNNDDIIRSKQKESFHVFEYKRDISVTKDSAQQEFFASQMNVRRRQLVAQLNGSSVTTQSGAMQWTVGSIEATSGIKGVGDMMGKMLKGAVTKESAVKPEYEGSGILVLEPTYKHILLMDLDDWGGGIVVEDGMFLACDSHVQHKAVRRSNISSSIAGGEGFFNLGLMGSGIVALESLVPEEELITVDLKDDVLKIDGSLAVAWSPGLSFTVERSGKSLLGSAASGEGLVNVYRGSGRVLMSPIAPTVALPVVSSTVTSARV